MIFLVEIVKFGIVFLKLIKVNIPILSNYMFNYKLPHQPNLATTPNPFVAIFEEVSTAWEFRKVNL